MYDNSLTQQMAKGSSEGRTSGTGDRQAQSVRADKGQTMPRPQSQPLRFT